MRIVAIRYTHWRRSQIAGVTAVSNSATTHLAVSSDLSIPRSELEFRASRSSGPGGQHVNRSSTRIELLWDLANSSVVSSEQRDRLRKKLASRMSAAGVVRVVASDRRSQAQNRASAEHRLTEILRRALEVPKTRRATKPTRASKERRLETKRRRSER